MPENENKNESYKQAELTLAAAQLAAPPDGETQIFHRKLLRT